MSATLTGAKQVLLACVHFVQASQSARIHQLAALGDAQHSRGATGLWAARPPGARLPHAREKS
jgi:hypothetical protein